MARGNNTTHKMTKMSNTDLTRKKTSVNQHAHEWRVGHDEDHKICLVMISTETQEQRSIVWKVLTSAE